MYTGLLTCSYADCLTVFYKAYGIGLGVFQDDQRNLHIPFCLFRQILILCNQIGDQRIVNGKLLTSLLKCNAENFLVLQRRRNVIRIDLDHIVIAFFLLFENFQSFFCIAGSDHAVRNFPFDQQSRIFVADIRQRDKITERRHTVRASGSGISTGDRGKVFPVHIIHPVDLCQCLCQRKSYRSSCRRYVFKRSCRRQTCGFFQISYQLPAIESIQEINIAGFSAEHLNGKVSSVCQVDPGRLLVGVAAVF